MPCPVCRYLEKGGRGGRGQNAHKGCNDPIRYGFDLMLMHGIISCAPLHGTRVVTCMHAIISCAPLHGARVVTCMHDITSCAPLHAILPFPTPLYLTTSPQRPQLSTLTWFHGSAIAPLLHAQMVERLVALNLVKTIQGCLEKKSLNHQIHDAIPHLGHGGVDVGALSALLAERAFQHIVVHFGAATPLHQQPAAAAQSLAKRQKGNTLFGLTARS